MKFTKKTLKRAYRTFIQAAVACIVVGIKVVDFSSDKETIKAALITLAVSAISAGLAAVMNLEKKELDNNV